jgi:hypothetical protein
MVSLILISQQLFLYPLYVLNLIYMDIYLIVRFCLFFIFREWNFYVREVHSRV